MQPQLFSMTVEQVYWLAPGVKQFVLNGMVNFQYLPGQFITLHFEHKEKVYKRSYSIANAPEHSSGKIEFAASFVEHGVGTEFLFALQPNDVVHLSGPYGRLLLKAKPPERYVFVGTGTGVTPYRAMLPQLQLLIEANESIEVLLLQGVRTRDDLLYAEEFRAFSRLFPRIQFRACLSRQHAGGLQEDERLGHVQDQFADFSLDPARDLVYLCGNPNMIDDAFSQLTALGFTTQQVVREKYISNK